MMTAEQPNFMSLADPEKLAKVLQDQIAADLQANPLDEMLFGYDIEQSKNYLGKPTGALRVAPTCFKSVEAWKGRRDMLQVTVFGREWRIVTSIDDRLRLVFTVESTPLQFDIHLHKKFNRSGKTTISIMTSPIRIAELSVKHADWKVCEKPAGDNPAAGAVSKKKR